MISPEEINTVTFERTMRGYRCEDVNEYLQQIAQTMIDKNAELDDMKSKILILAQKVEEYRKEEDTLKTAMINAQRMGESVIKEAKQKAEEIIREANIRAEDREQHSRDEVGRAQEELDRLCSEVAQFKKTVLGLYKEHIESLSKLPTGEDGAPTLPDLSDSEPEDSAKPEEEAHDTHEFAAAEFPPQDFSQFEEDDDEGDEEYQMPDAEETNPEPEDGEEKPATEDASYEIPPALDSFRGISFND